MKSPVAPRGSAQFNLRLPEDLRDRIAAEAKLAGRSMNTEIVTRLIASLDGNRDVSAKLDRILALLERK